MCHGFFETKERTIGDLECLRRRLIGLMADLTSSWENALLKSL